MDNRSPDLLTDGANALELEFNCFYLCDLDAKTVAGPCPLSGRSMSALCLVHVHFPNRP
jgi:hypothetical protein